MSTDNNFEKTRKHFSDKEWQDLPITKKLRYANQKTNSDIMVKFGAEQHVDSRHAVFYCDTRGAYPCSAEHLEGQLMQQEEQRPQGRHKCTYCSYSTNHTGNIADHERTHTGERPFICYVCEKGFSQTSSLDRHLNIHCQIKPYVCADCGIGFNTSSNLARHRKLHSNAVQAHMCSVCYKSFSRKDNLKRHLLCHELTGRRARL